MADVNGPTLMSNGAVPNCKLDFGQSGAYNYNGGCGWCDYKGMCKTNGFCNECCTNLDDPAKYNGCRFRVVGVTTINNTGGTINIPKSKAFVLSQNTVYMTIENSAGVETKMYKKGGTVNWVGLPSLILLMI